MVPSSFFATLQSAFTRFIWGRSRPRLHRTILSLPKASGDVGASDLYHYHVAAVLNRLVNWFHHSHSKQLVSIEQSITPYELQALPWIDPSFRGPPSSLPFLTSHLLWIWDKLLSRLKLSSQAGPMTPLLATHNSLLRWPRHAFYLGRRSHIFN